MSSKPTNRQPTVHSSQPIANGYKPRSLLMPTVLSILRAAAVIGSGALAACITTTPPTSVMQPMSVRPVAATGPQVPNGAIYQVNGQASYGYRPLFEDRRARSVGDTLTVVISENTSANKKSDTSAKRKSDNKFGVTDVSGLPGKSFLG